MIQKKKFTKKQKGSGWLFGIKNPKFNISTNTFKQHRLMNNIQTYLISKVPKNKNISQNNRNTKIKQITHKMVSARDKYNEGLYKLSIKEIQEAYELVGKKMKTDINNNANSIKNNPYSSRVDRFKNLVKQGNWPNIPSNTNFNRFGIGNDKKNPSPIIYSI